MMRFSAIGLCKLITLAFLGLSFALGSLPALAESSKADTGDRRIQALRTCRETPEPTARLACFDAISSELIAAADQGELRIVDKDALQKTKRRLFGFALPDLGLFGRDDAPELAMLETTVASVRRGQGGSWIFSTPESGTWEIRDAPFSFRDPKAGDKAVIKRASLGSYFVRINDQVGLKGKRIG